MHLYLYSLAPTERSTEYWYQKIPHRRRRSELEERTVDEQGNQSL